MSSSKKKKKKKPPPTTGKNAASGGGGGGKRLGSKRNSLVDDLLLFANDEKTAEAEAAAAAESKMDESARPPEFDLWTKDAQKKWLKIHANEVKKRKAQAAKAAKKREQQKQNTKMRFDKKSGRYVVANKAGIRLDDLMQSDLARTIEENLAKKDDDDGDDDDDGNNTGAAAASRKRAMQRNKSIAQLDRMAESVYPKTASGEVPVVKVKDVLRWCRKGKTSKVERAISGSLISSGMHINMVDEYGHTPLIVASAYGHERLVRGLIRLGADTNTTDNVGGTPLHHAAIMGHVECIKSLLNGGADCTRVDVRRCSPLHYACEYGRWETAATLLQVTEVPVNWQDTNGFSPLMRAVMLPAEDNTLDVIDTLAAAGADFDARNKAGSTVMYLASKNKALYPLVLKLLNEVYPEHPLAVQTSKEETRKEEMLRRTKDEERESKAKVKYEDKLLEMSARAVGAVIANASDVVHDEYVPPKVVVVDDHDGDHEQKGDDNGSSGSDDDSSSDDDDSFGSDDDLHNGEGGPAKHSAIEVVSLVPVTAPAPVVEEPTLFAHMFTSMSSATRSLSDQPPPSSPPPPPPQVGDDGDDTTTGDTNDDNDDDAEHTAVEGQ